MFGPVLCGKKIVLRPPIVGDAEKLVAWFRDPDVTRYRAGRALASVQQEEDFLKHVANSKDDVWWAIEAEGRTIGTTDIHDIDWVSKHAITGTVIGDKTAWHKGYGSEAMALRTAHAFRVLGLHKLKS